LAHQFQNRSFHRCNILVSFGQHTDLDQSIDVIAGQVHGEDTAAVLPPPLAISLYTSLAPLASRHTLRI
jgi:hypothetical protein